MKIKLDKGEEMQQHTEDNQENINVSYAAGWLSVNVIC